MAGIKGHTGYMGCGKCVQEGEYLKGRMCIPEVNLPLRTDESFASKAQKEHHLSTSPFETISSFGMVSQVPFEYMLLVCQGVMKKIILQWMRSKNLALRLRSWKIDNASRCLESLKKYICSEFSRKPRTLREVDRWKATEFRLVLLYIGPHVFKNTLSDPFYEHFLCLHVAMRILATPKLYIKRNAYAKSLMVHFIRVFEILYGRELISYNVHGLLHLSDDVLKFGPVDSFSAFEFENHLQTLKHYIRKSAYPLQQVANRLFEKQMASLPSCAEKNRQLSSNFITKKGLHFNGPLINGARNPQYTTMHYRNFIYSKNIADHCCILKNNSVIVIKNIATHNSGLVIIGHEFLERVDAFTVPCASAHVGIFLCSNLCTQLNTWPINSIKTRAMKIPKQGKYLVISLLHGIQM
jgi:hypothetical protein